MSKYLKTAMIGGLALALIGTASAAGNPEAGKAVFKKCVACHQIGEGAKNRVGPHLTDILGRTAATVDGFRYSKGMQKAGADGLVWTAETLDSYLEAPRKMIKGTRMAFAGLKKTEDRADVIAYMAAAGAAQEAEATRAAPVPQQAAAPTVPASAQPRATHGVFGLGRPATLAEITAWDIDVRPDGLGLPAGRGTVADGEPLFSERCAACHGDFGEGVGRWPVLAGGQDTLTEDRPEKTVGSYWPYLSTVFDYIRRAMPYGDAQSLTDDEVYAITAYVLYLNDIVTEEEFELSDENFNDVRLPNEQNFIADDRMAEPHYATGVEPCMIDCKASVSITMRARILDVTPDADEDARGAVQVD